MLQPVIIWFSSTRLVITLYFPEHFMGILQRDAFSLDSVRNSSGYIRIPSHATDLVRSDRKGYVDLLILAMHTC